MLGLEEELFSTGRVGGFGGEEESGAVDCAVGSEGEEGGEVGA